MYLIELFLFHNLNGKSSESIAKMDKKIAVERV